MKNEELVEAASRIGRYVSVRRKSFNVTQEELAELAGVSTRAISALESGKATTRLDILLRVLHALGVALADTLERR